MPARFVPLITEELYHVFNRGVNKQPIFFGKRDYQRAMDVCEFYSFAESKLRFSKFLLLSQEKKIHFWRKLREGNRKLVEIICFCFMPNHFHLLLKQKEENGISKFMSIFQNSFTRYMNTKYERIGPLLQGQFKAVRVEDENQLFHLSRYIHLNPYASFVVKKKEDLINYPWSSFPQYLRKTNNSFCSVKAVMVSFKNAEEYKNFVFDQADYQRELDRIKHLTFE